MSEFTYPIGPDPMTSAGVRESEVRRIMEARVRLWIERKRSARRWREYAARQERGALESVISLTQQHDTP